MGQSNSRIPPEEQLRQSKRQIRRGIREIDRQRTRLQTAEKKLIQEMRKLAKSNQGPSVRILARDLVRTRKNIEKFYLMRSQLQGVEMRLTTMKSTQSIGETMRTVGSAMVQFNKQMNLPELNNVMKQFFTENERMEMTQEMMGEAMDMAMENPGEAEESEEVVNQVLSEIGIDIAGQIGNAGVRNLQVNNQVEESKEDPLESRFAALR